MRDTSQDITPAMVGRKYIRKADKCIGRGKYSPPIAYTPEGKRVFAYNANGTPVCHARRQGKFDENGVQLHCQSTQTMPNGRCSIHGGKSLSGVLHPQATHLRNADCLPSHLQGDFNRAMMDPDMLDLKHEIALVDIEIADHKRNMGNDLISGAMTKLGNQLDTLEDRLETGAEVTEEMLQAIITTFRTGRNRDATNRKLHAAMEMRRRLADTAAHREKDLKTMIRAEQAMALITALAAGCKEAVEMLFTNLAKRYILIDRDKLYMLTPENKGIVEELDATAIDRAFKNDFLGDIAIKLGGLIDKARDTMEGDPSKNTAKNPLAIVGPGRRPRVITEATASD